VEKRLLDLSDASRLAHPHRREPLRTKYRTNDSPKSNPGNRTDDPGVTGCDLLNWKLRLCLIQRASAKGKCIYWFQAPLQPCIPLPVFTPIIFHATALRLDFYVRMYLPFSQPGLDGSRKGKYAVRRNSMTPFLCFSAGPGDETHSSIQMVLAWARRRLQTVTP
jgi:hypothetical protein